MSKLISPFGSLHSDYIRDESRKVGNADFIAFPNSEEDIIEIIKTVSKNEGGITTQGARTGITASAVPQGGTILNLSRMNNISSIRTDSASGISFMTVQPGAALSEIRKVAAIENMFFPPDPTETSASIGGMVACNASGAISFHYGSTRKWIHALRAVLADGSVIELKRGNQTANGRHFCLTTTDGKTLTGDLPKYTMPNVKNAAGYYAADNMDIIDLFIGMEGTLGIITEIELKLIAKPKHIVGLTAFLPSEKSALAFVNRIRSISDSNMQPVAIEFFNCTLLDLMRKARAELPAFGDLPQLPPNFHSAIYLEYHCDNEDAVDEKIINTAELIMEMGGSENDCWCATTAAELDKLKTFRHAAPELVNLKIDEYRKEYPLLTKLGTDMSVPDSKLEIVMQMYSDGLKAKDLDYVIFGHIGNNHVHVNIIPKNMKEYTAGKELYLEWAEKVIDLGGSISAEHGIGKIKIAFLELMYGKDGITQMKKTKSVFDTKGILNPGTLFTQSAGKHP
jgi:D-lactate dehydrogenase (cytochrome)